MNYLKELVSFHEWLDTNPLQSGAIALWHTLMGINNKTNWSGEFTVANLTLQAKCGLSRQQLDRSRTQLINAGRIDYKKSGRANQAGTYSMVSYDTQKGHETIHEPVTERAQSGHEVTTLLKHKLNETKQEDDKTSAPINPFIFFEQEGFGTLTQTTGEMIGDLVDHYHEEPVLAAMKEAVVRGARNLKYVEAILKNPNKGKQVASNVHPFTSPTKAKVEPEYDYGF